MIVADQRLLRIVIEGEQGLEYWVLGLSFLFSGSTGLKLKGAATVLGCSGW